jgi:iron complex transport system ATP-binding protein
MFGSIELMKPAGDKPEVFVISSGGTGIPVFRELQKTNTAFAAGVLYENDMDYQLARLLACEVVTEKPFEEIGDEAFNRAKKLIDESGRVIDAGVKIGTCNCRIKDLIEYAESQGKL